MPRDAEEYSDGAFLDLIDQMLAAGMSNQQISEAFEDWFSIELLLEDGVLNLTKENLAEIARRFGWIHGGVIAFLALGISYSEYCERRNRRKQVTIEEHRPVVDRRVASLTFGRQRSGHAQAEEGRAGPLVSADEPRTRPDPESVPRRRTPQLPKDPTPPPPPAWLLSQTQRK